MPGSIERNKLGEIRLPLIHVDDFKPSILSLHFKRFQREKYEQHAPSIKTRKRVGLYFPDQLILNQHKRNTVFAYNLAS